MGKTHGGALALLGAAALVHVGCGCASSPKHEEPAATTPSLAPQRRVAIGPDDVVEAPERAALLGLVTPLQSGSPRARVCTATPMGPRTILTAAHCVAQERVAFAGSSQVDHSDLKRACRGVPCSRALTEPETGDESDFTRNDFATAAIKPSAPLLSHRALRVVDVSDERELTNAYMVSTGRPYPLLICRFQILDGEGIVHGGIDLGDSGSPLVILPADGSDEPGVIGVVSRRIAGSWFFSPVDGELPWPRLATDPERPVESLTFQISEDPRCARGGVP